MNGRLTALLEGIVDPVILIDSRAYTLGFNTAAAKAWPALSRGYPLAMVLRSPDVVGAVEAVLQSGQRRAVRMVERVPIERVYDLTVTALERDHENALAEDPAAMLVFRDLTESHRIEMMRVDFVANASHELRTPLAAMLGFIETLQGPARNDEAARERFLGIMAAQARRMARLIDDLLSLSRIEISEHRQPETPVDLGQVLKQMVDAMRRLAADQGVEIHFAPPERPLIVTGERDDLLRVAENLIENAIKYGDTGKKVDIAVREVVDGGRPAAQFSVKDHGPGIAAEHLPRLTERFYRANVAASRGKGGTGLGLAIVKHVVNKHRGRLVIESQVGHGATFRVLLPLRAEALNAVAGHESQHV